METKEAITLTPHFPHYVLSPYHLKYPLPYGGIVYPCLYAAYVSFKTTDRAVLRKLSQAELPADIRGIENALPTPLYWTYWHRIETMKRLCKMKLDRYPELWGILLLDNKLPIEHHLLHDDTFWGIYEGKGANRFGIILMELRASRTKANYEK